MPAFNVYEKYLGNRDPVTVLAATPGILYGTLSRLLADAASQDAVNQQPAPGKWSLREILAHLADCEIAFGFRLRQALAEPDHTVQPFDQEQWALHYGRYDAPSALTTFVTLRKWNMLLLNSLRPEEWDSVVNHPERGAGTLRDLAALSAGHDLNHLEHITQLAHAATPPTHHFAIP